MSVYRRNKRDNVLLPLNPTKMCTQDRWLLYFSWADTVIANLMKSIIPLHVSKTRANFHMLFNDINIGEGTNVMIVKTPQFFLDQLKLHFKILLLINLFTVISFFCIHIVKKNKKV